MITIDWHELGIPAGEKPFAEGAVGALFHVRNSLPAFPGRKLVAKMVKAKLPDGLDRKFVLGQMRSVVGRRDGLSADELADLDAVSVWPLAMVRQNGDDVGILLDLIEGAFFVDAKPGNGMTSKVLFELQFLCVSDGYFTKRGIDPAVTGDMVQRLALAMRLAYAIEVVHRQPVVYGDLHLKNAVAAAKPYARVMLLDCDGVAELGDTSRVQLHGLGFIPPEISGKKQTLQDQATDVYKLGLCIIRMLSKGKGATQSTDPTKTVSGILDQEGIDLLTRAVSSDRSQRPRALDLREYLVRRLHCFIQVPELLSAELSHRVVLRGSNVFVRWQQRHGDEVRIFGANGYAVAGIDANAHATGYAIQPPTAGPIDIEVWNKDGPSVRLRAGFLDYYELPALDIGAQLRGAIPRPVIPQVPSLDASVFEVLEPYPVVAHPDLSIEISSPTIEFPAARVGYPSVNIDLGHGSPGVRIDARLAAALERLEGRISRSMRRMTKTLRNHAANDPNPGTQPAGSGP